MPYFHLSSFLFLIFYFYIILHFASPQSCCHHILVICRAEGYYCFYRVGNFLVVASGLVARSPKSCVAFIETILVGRLIISVFLHCRVAHG